jgi:hypothetical protein
MPETIDAKFETIEQGQCCQHFSSGYLTVRNEADWLKLWSELNASANPTATLPSIDFEKEMVVGAFLGMKSTGGYSVSITKVLETEKCLEVYVSLHKPSPGAMVTQALTQPYHIVKLPATSKEVTYKL